MIGILKVRNAKALSIKLSFIKLLTSLLGHKSGIKYIKSSNLWEGIYQMSMSSGCDEIVRESVNFISKLLEETMKFDEDFTDSVVKKIMSPLGESIFKSIKETKNRKVASEVASKYIKPSFKLITDVLECLLERILTEKKVYQVVIIFYQNFHLQERINDFMMLSELKCLSIYLGKIMFIMQFLQLYVKIVLDSVSVTDINATIEKIKKNFTGKVTKGTAEETLAYCYFGKLYWKVLEKCTDVASTDCVSFSNELTIFQVVPFFALLMKYCYERGDFERLFEEDFRDNFVYKCLKMACNDSIRGLYSWRSSLLEHDDLFEICERCTRHMDQLRKYTSRDVAVVIVQAFVFILKDIVYFCMCCREKLLYFVKHVSYFEQIFHLVSTIIDDFDVTWKDSMESIDLLTILFEFLSLYEWPSHIVSLVLKLVDSAISKYMAPDMALLVDATSECSLNIWGPLLFAKLRNEVMEIRKSALGVICTLAWISRCKFPSLQKVLMDSELPTLVVKMSTCDGESFVRATAIKCLQEMIQVEEIWNNALKSEDLPEKMRHILMNETEGIVRVEAATFMCVAYEHQQFPKENLDGIYETMIYSSTTDLHWEVKVRALNFWDKVIKNHLQNQGMIDDSFPNVTFSKEHRKIVTLTDVEIRKRLLKVLSQLSSIGCLGVLMSAIKDDCDMEVSKTAVKITQRLIDLFKKYNVRSESSTPNSPAATENGMSTVASVSSGISVDESMDSPASTQPEVNEEVIDQIVNSKDVCLLKNVYTPSDYGSVSNYDIQVRKIVTPNEFLVFCQQDLNSLIAEKKNWLNGIEDLGSLLDDMLKTYDDDVNNMDCY